MNKTLKMALAAGALLAISLAAPAQTPTQSNPPRARAGAVRLNAPRANGFLLTIPASVMNAITPLQPDQQTKIEAIHAQLKADLKAAVGDKVKQMQLRQQAMADVRTVLTPTQITEINRAQVAVNWLTRTHTIPIRALPQVKLTSSQFEQIRAISLDEQTKMRATPKDQRTTVRPQIEADFKTRISAVMTDQQKQIAASAK